MTLLPFLQTLGISPSLSSRPASALMTLWVLLFFHQIDNPVWLIGWIPGGILLLFVLAEWNIGKEMIAMELVESFMPVIKVLLAIAVSLAMLEADSSAVLNFLMSEETAETAVASSPWWETAIKWVWSLIMGVFTWYASIYRNSYLFFISQFDEDNDLGLITLYSWAELFFSVGNGILALFFPIAAIVLFIFTAVGLRLLRTYLEKQEDSKRIACTNQCGTQIYGSALICPTCSSKNPTPMRVGLLGQTKDTPITNRDAHRWELLAQKRCPRCATHFKGRSMNQVCEACQEQVLETPEAVKQYVQHFESKLYPTMGFCALVGWIPFVGLLIGVVYYRLTLVSPMRRYVPAMQGCMGRWGTRLINLILISFQAIPGVGLIVLPLMCYINFHIYKSLMLHSQYRPDNSPKPVQKLA